ncbi:hypothetical protein E4U42_006757 [Claviceps africana]|uniref:Uncharacterized protein n=1 Tax=Claviceps africana TaxID=83212 RepID=A0A8K0NGL2_9HYPO|nr:hypothetical protein E4U42_006757 [Claviceps africana]
MPRPSCRAQTRLIEVESLHVGKSGAIAMGHAAIINEASGFSVRNQNPQLREGVLMTLCS